MDMQTESEKLSIRELEILRLVATGASNKEIARQLDISTNTVKVHLRNIFTKINVTSRTEAAMYAVNAGFVYDMPPHDTAAAESNGVSPGASPQAVGEALAQPAAQQSKPGHLARPILLAGIVLVVLVILIWQVSGSIKPAQLSEVSVISSQAAPLEWHDLAPMPTARYGLAAASYDGQIYAIAGMGEEGVTGVVEKYAIASDIWNLAAPKPTPVYEAAAALVNGLIYVPGGRLDTDTVTGILEIYDPQLDLWTEGQPMPAARSGYSLAVFEGQLYLFGGWDGNSVRNETYRYNPQTDSWDELPSMPTKRAYSGAAVAGRDIYVFGGYDGTQAMAVTEVFHPDMKSKGVQAWDQRRALPETTYAMGAASFIDIIFSFGGKAESERKYPVLAYLYPSDEWRAVQGLGDFQDAFMGTASAGADFYTLGGLRGDVPLTLNRTYRLVYTLSFPIIIR